jgi:hypothetical protein
MGAVKVPNRGVVFINRAVSVKEPSGSVVIKGDDDHLAEFLDLIATGFLDADEFFSCHFVALLS